MARLSLRANRATTISRFFYVPAGHQPCLDFLCASRTSTKSELFYVLAGHQPCMDFLMEALIGFQRKCLKDNFY